MTAILGYVDLLAEAPGPAERERIKERAGILRRSKWWVFGMPERENATEGADSEL